MTDILSLAVLVGILTSAIRLATPYLYAAVGEAFAQSSGVVNLGVDGIMLVGAFAAFYVVLHTGNLWLGVLASLLAGLLMGLLMSVISVTLKAEQGISGIGLYMFGLGLSSLLFKVTVGTVKTVTGFQPVKIPLLGDIPVLGEVLFSQNVLVYLALLLVPASWWVLEKTTWGLKIKAAGQNPAKPEAPWAVPHGTPLDSNDRRNPSPRNTKPGKQRVVAKLALRGRFNSNPFSRSISNPRWPSRSPGVLSFRGAPP